MKHGFKPLVGLTKTQLMDAHPYNSYRIGLYWFMLQIEYDGIFFFYNKKLQYALEWNKKATPVFKISVKRGRLLWGRKIKNPAPFIWEYSWKRENV